MCYIVFMADTIAISVRLPKELLGKLDQSAAEADRSRNWIIVDALETVYEETGGGSSVAEQRSSSPPVAGSSPAPRSTNFSGFANQIDQLVAEKKSGHDTKTCRVYKCGICAALKSKEK